MTERQTDRHTDHSLSLNALKQHPLFDTAEDARLRLPLVLSLFASMSFSALSHSFAIEASWAVLVHYQ